MKITKAGKLKIGDRVTVGNSKQIYYIKEINFPHVYLEYKTDAGQLQFIDGGWIDVCFIELYKEK